MRTNEVETSLNIDALNIKSTLEYEDYEKTLQKWLNEEDDGDIDEVEEHCMVLSYHGKDI